MRRIIALILFSMAVVGGVAGCGSGAAGGSAVSGQAGGSAGGTAQVMTVMRQISQCVRRHGVPNFPDPVINSLTNYPDFPASAPRIPPGAQQACQSAFSQLPPQATTSHPPTAANMSALLRFAGCVRGHGLPAWPDPNPLGQFPISGKSDAMRSALIACVRLVPGGAANLQFVRAGGGGG